MRVQPSLTCMDCQWCTPNATGDEYCGCPATKNGYLRKGAPACEHHTIPGAAATGSVFVSYNHGDEELATKLVSELRKAGVAVWFDRSSLLPGDRWQDVLEKILNEASSAVVLVGANGLGHWQNAEVRALLGVMSQRDTTIVPALLPGGEESKLPLFIRDRTWVDFGDGFTKKAVARLVSALRAA